MLTQWLSRMREYFVPRRGKRDAGLGRFREHAWREALQESRDDLTQIRGIGETTMLRLYSAGFTTFERLGRATPAQIRGIPGRLAPGAKVEEWIVRARELAKRP